MREFVPVREFLLTSIFFYSFIVGVGAYTKYFSWSIENRCKNQGTFLELSLKNLGKSGIFCEKSPESPVSG